MGNTSKDLLPQLLAVSPEQALQLLNTYPTKDELIYQLSLYKVATEYYHELLDDHYPELAQYNQAFENKLNQQQLLSWAEANLPAAKRQKMMQISQTLEELLFNDSCHDWWDVEAYGWDQTGKFEQYGWFDDVEMQRLLDILPQLRPFIADNDLVFTLLQINMSNFLEDCILDLPKRKDTASVSPNTELLQLRVIEQLGQILTTRSSAHLLGIELLLVCHLRLPNGNPKLIKKYWQILSEQGRCPCYLEVVRFYLFHDQNADFALNTWLNIETTFMANKASGIQWTWLEAEEALFHELTKQSPTFDESQLLIFVQKLLEKYPHMIYFKAFWAKHQPYPQQQAILLEVLNNLPQDVYFTSSYGIIRSKDVIRSYRHILQEEHLQAVMALNPDDLQQKQLKDLYGKPSTTPNGRFDAVKQWLKRFTKHD
jgi:hypothetical protein